MFGSHFVIVFQYKGQFSIKLINAHYLYTILIYFLKIQIQSLRIKRVFKHLFFSASLNIYYFCIFDLYLMRGWLIYPPVNAVRAILTGLPLALMIANTCRGRVFVGDVRRARLPIFLVPCLARQVMFCVH